MIALAVAVMYGGVVVCRFGLLDDYTFLDLARITPVIDETGRPINNFVREGVFRRVRGIDGLAIARGLGLVSIFAVGLCLFFFLRGMGRRRLEATAISIALLALPPFQVVAAWAQLLIALWPIVFAFLAMRLTDAPARTRGRTMLNLAAAALLILCGLMIYQPTAMMCLVFPLVAQALGARPPDWRPLARIALVFCLALAAYAVYVHFSVELAVWVYGGGFERIRSRLCDDPLGKAAWFIRGPLVDAWGLYSIEKNVILSAIVGLLGIAGAALARVERPTNMLRRIGLATLAIPAAALPILLARENYAAWRSMIGLALLAGLLAAAGLVAAARFARIGKRAGAIMWTTGAIAATALGCTRTWTEFILPQMRELAILKRAVTELPAGAALHIHMIRPTPADRLSPHAGEEFGSPSTYVAWTPKHMLRLLAREIGRDPDGWEISSSIDRAAPNGAVVIDMPALLAATRAGGFRP